MNRIRIFTCECEDAVCECTREGGGDLPPECPYGHEPHWKKGSEGWR